MQYPTSNMHLLDISSQKHSLFSIGYPSPCNYKSLHFLRRFCRQSVGICAYSAKRLKRVFSKLLPQGSNLEQNVGSAQLSTIHWKMYISSWTKNEFMELYDFIDIYQHKISHLKECILYKPLLKQPLMSPSTVQHVTYK